jgi:hypothetical protein
LKFEGFSRTYKLAALAEAREYFVENGMDAKVP